MRVFLDAAVLTPTTSLWGDIETALDNSEYLIFLASEESARSKWVQREIEHWLRKKGEQGLIIALTGGNLVWNFSSKDFDRQATNCIPPALYGAFQDFVCRCENPNVT